jgi:signal transduction histidine kinase/CheY-like chemotaxis protein
MSPENERIAAKQTDKSNDALKVWRRFRIAFAVALVLLLVTVGLAIKASRDNQAARQWVFHTHEVIECMTELGERASSRELALRNFVRSGNVRFRDRYLVLDGEAQAMSDMLIALVVDNPLQTERAHRLDALVDERSRDLATLLKTYRSENSENILAANLMPSSTAQGLMDEAMATFRNEEHRLLGERQRRLDRSATFIQVLVPVIGLTGLFILTGCQLALGRYMEQTRRSYEEVKAMKRVADEANAFKSAFLANVSHEIRTPLAAVLGYTDILRSSVPSTPAERDECLRTIRRSGEQVLTIVNDILDLSKIEAGRMTTENIPCCVVEVIGDVASLFRRVAVNRGLFFEVKYKDPIPDQVRTDPARLRQVLMNLVGNAVKFTERGGVRLIVDVVRETGAAPLLRVQVIDTGIGLSKEVAGTLFQPFIQGDVSTTRRFGGTGLGLTISKHFAELLGGGIKIESEVGKGSTFTLTVATGSLAGVRMLTGVEEASRSSKQPEGVKAPRLNGLRFLVGEDGLDNQQIILFHLREVGAEVTLAENGKIAVQLATEMAEKNRPFDLILMDMQMPVMDGYTATKTLRDRRYTGPIVALTANAMAHDREKCLTAGCNGFITKPIQWPAFWATVRRFITEASEATAAVKAGPAKVAAVAEIVAQQPPAVETPAPEGELAQLKARFSKVLPDRLAEIRAAFERQDRVKMRFLVHSLSGAAASYGFPEVTDMARELDVNHSADENRVIEMLKALDSSAQTAMGARAA